MSNPEIYCPACKWRPRAEDRWECIPSCGTVSPHKAWYHYPEGATPPAEIEHTELAD